MSCCGPFVPRLPTFNLPFRYFHDFFAHVGSPGDPEDVAGMCQLAVRTSVGGPTTLYVYSALVLVPKSTDIRCNNWDGAGAEPVIEIPSGSNRWYNIEVYEDVHKGFSNEYRSGVLAPFRTFGPWPFPDP